MKLSPVGMHVEVCIKDLKRLDAAANRGDIEAVHHIAAGITASMKRICQHIGDPS